MHTYETRNRINGTEPVGTHIGSNLLISGLYIYIIHVHDVNNYAHDLINKLATYLFVTLQYIQNNVP